MEITSGELRRIMSGPPEDAGQAPIVRVTFGSDDAWDVIDRARDVLAGVLGQVELWPSDDSWPDLLPSWFVERCAPESEAAVEAWTLSDWLYCFDPVDGEGDDRSWWWWDAGSDEPGKGWFDVATTGWPFGTGSLYWLIEACGGVDPHC